MYYTIYQITNKLDGKIYIGKHQTYDLNDAYMGSGKHLTRAQKKHGLENFKKQILFVFETEEEMNSKEAELVSEEFCAREDTYNICSGGKGGWGYINSNRDWSEHNFKIAKNRSYQEPALIESLKSQNKKNKLSAAHASGSYRHVYGISFKGKKHSEETKKFMSVKASENQAGYKNSQFGTCWITNGIITKKHKVVDIIPEGWYKGRISLRSS